MPTVITILSLILVGWGFGAVLCAMAKRETPKFPHSSGSIGEQSETRDQRPHTADELLSHTEGLCKKSGETGRNRASGPIPLLCGSTNFRKLMAANTRFLL